MGRPGKWGNPYVVGVHGRRKEVIQLYREYLEGRPDLLASLQELHGKTLGCWCAPLPCHADVLLELANDPPAKER